MNVLNIVALSVLAGAVLVHAIATVLHVSSHIRLPLFRRLRMVRHVRLVARIRDWSQSKEVQKACDDLLHALVK